MDNSMDMKLLRRMNVYGIRVLVMSRPRDVSKEDAEEWVLRNGVALRLRVSSVMAGMKEGASEKDVEARVELVMLKWGWESWYKEEFREWKAWGCEGEEEI